MHSKLPNTSLYLYSICQSNLEFYFVIEFAASWCLRVTNDAYNIINRWSKKIYLIVNTVKLHYLDTSRYLSIQDIEAKILLNIGVQHIEVQLYCTCLKNHKFKKAWPGFSLIIKLRKSISEREKTCFSLVHPHYHFHKQNRN